MKSGRVPLRDSVEHRTIDNPLNIYKSSFSGRTEAIHKTSFSENYEFNPSPENMQLKKKNPGYLNSAGKLLVKTEDGYFREEG